MHPLCIRQHQDRTWHWLAFRVLTDGLDYKDDNCAAGWGGFMEVRPIALNASLHGICMACTILLTEMPLVHPIHLIDED